jgi:hypothetical protein
VNREFAFEAKINDTLDCLPMSVKRKLDRVELKIGRKQWLGMRPEERMAIWHLPAESREECEALRRFIRGVLARYGTEPISLPEAVGRLSEPPVEVPAAVIESAREVGFLLDQQKWSKLVVCNIEIDSRICYQWACLEQPSDCRGLSIRNCKREFARGCCAPVTGAARG